MKLNNIETTKNINKEVMLAGWVHSLRKMGKIMFLDLRDISAIVQVVLVPSELDKESAEIIKSIKPVKI